MPITPSISMQSFLGATTFRFARLWAIMRTDGVVLRYTDHNTAIDYAGDTYTPAVFDASAGETKEGFSENNVELRGYLAASEITKEDLRARMYADATVTVLVVDWRYPFAGYYRKDTMSVESVEYTGEVWQASVLGLAGLLRRKVGKVLNRDCGVSKLGDSRCGVDIEAHRKSGEVTAINEYSRVITVDLVDATGLYDLGEITWTGGNNSGRISEVKKYENSGSAIVTLQLRAPYEVQVGDTFTIIPGCRRIREDCKGTSGTGGKPWANNINNFDGYPNMPGARIVLKTPDAK